MSQSHDEITEENSIGRFIDDHGLTMTSEPAPENPNMGDPVEGMQHYYCTIKSDQKTTLDPSMGSYYSVGPGIVESWLRLRRPENVRERLLWEAFKNNPRCVDAAKYVEICGKKYRPKLADVLDCLAMDASGADESFEGWAGDYGYDIDSRKAEKTYRACQDNARQLRNLLGYKAFQTLVDEVERL